MLKAAAGAFGAAEDVEAEEWVVPSGEQSKGSGVFFPVVFG
jgi:hypothetical protein